MTRSEAIRFVAIRSLGNFLLLFSIYGVIATFGPAFLAETQFRIAQVRGVQFEVPEGIASEAATAENEGSSGGGFADVLAGEKEQILIPKDTDFSIVIPKIGASSKVIPNVDPVNESNFLPSLQEGVAHAKGSVFPGLPGNVYLFAHSADNWWNVGRYNAVFYLLIHLQPGDEIIVFFEGIRYEYVVRETFIEDPDYISLLTDAQKGDKEQLVLQTCWPPGTTWKRFYVIAEPK